MAEAIKVAVRVRPTNQREKDKGCTVVISMKDKTTTVHGGKTPKHFTYDNCYWSLDEADDVFHTQSDVFLDIGQAILTNALNGFNGTLFTYGQTGSGKSYTVMGPPNDPGIIPRTVANLFQWKPAGDNVQRELQIWISYLEIYKEAVTDLLCPDAKQKETLTIMDHPKIGVYVKGLQEVPCTTYEDVMKNMQFGIKKRVTAATNMNAQSSRSHSVFTIKVNILDGEKPKAGKKDERKTLSAKVNLIDLAGSERQSKAGTENERLKEGNAINQSLSALGMVIKSLSEAGSRKSGESGSIAPFRMSKLTFLLKDSLAGNSKTHMMATISPANDNMEETISTLRFASSVKTIQTVAVQNKDQKDQLIEKMEEEIRLLKAQAGTGPGACEANVLIQERERLKEELKKDFQQEFQKAQDMQKAREQALEENGLSQFHITQAFGIDKGTPYLLNMADDPMLAGCLIYLIKESEQTLIGAHKDNTITLKGVGIPDFLCRIENRENTKVSLERTSSEGRVVVNGKLLHPDEVRDLHNADHIFLGRAYALKLIMPSDPSTEYRAPRSTLHDLSLEGLEDEYAAFDDSPSWRSMTEYLDGVLRKMSTKDASQLLKEMKRACRFCDEANELTSECRVDENLHFEVDLTSSVPACVVIRVLHCPEGSDCQVEDSWETKYLWSLSQIVARVERMRDCCSSFKRVGYMEIDPIEDPWHESEPDMIAQRIRTLENIAEEARADMLSEHVKKLRTLMVVRPGDRAIDGMILQFFFRFWKTHAEKTRKDGQTRGRMKVISKRRASSATSDGGSSPRNKNRLSTSSSATAPASSARRLSTDSSATAGTEGERPQTSQNRPGKRRTLKNGLGGASGRTGSLSPERLEEHDKGEKSRRDAEELARSRVTICSDISHISASTAADGSSRSHSVATSALATTDLRNVEAPEATPEQDVLRAVEKPATLEKQTEVVKMLSVAEVVVDEAALRENDVLRRQLHDSQAANDDLRKQLDIAWQLCGVLRDYAGQLRDGPAETLQQVVEAPPVTSVPSSPSRPAPQRSSSSPSPASAQATILAAAHPPGQPPAPGIPRTPRSQGQFNAAFSASASAPLVTRVQGTPPTPMPLPPPMAVVPSQREVSPAPWPAPATVVREVSPAPSPPRPVTVVAAQPAAVATTRLAHVAPAIVKRAIQTQAPAQASNAISQVRRLVTPPSQLSSASSPLLATNGVATPDRPLHQPALADPHAVAAWHVSASASSAVAPSEPATLSLQPRPAQPSGSSSSPALVSRQSSREKSRLTVLEEQVRCIAESLGAPVLSQ